MTTTSVPAHSIRRPPPLSRDVILEELEANLPTQLPGMPTLGAAAAMLLTSELPSALFHDDRALFRRGLSALVDVSVAVWTTTERRGPVRFGFDGTPLTGEGGPVHWSCTDGYWVDSVLRALLLRRADAVSHALAFPPELLGRASRLERDAYRPALFRALRSLLSETPVLAGGAIAEAQRLTDPAIATIGGPRWARLARGELDVMASIARRDAAAFTSSMATALEAHRALFGRGRERSYIDCFYAFRLMGLAALAIDRGLPFEIDCAYVPAWLVQGGV